MFDKRVLILKDETPLKEWFNPEKILHREGQKQELGNCLKPVTLNRSPRNAFLYGPCGTGKTSLVQYVLQELEKHSSARTAYVNCWKRNTTHACLTEILSALDVFVNYRQATADLLKILEKEAKQRKVVVALDEFDALETPELLYDLSRSQVGMVVISNDAYALSDIDQRIKSSLSAEGIEFPAYSTDEVFNILKDRRQYAFPPNAAPETALKTVARLCEGDARIALETLRRAALIAEDKNKTSLSSDDVKEAFKSTHSLRKTEALKKLGEHEKVLYMILEKEEKLGTKELYEKYCKKVKEPATSRSYRNYMNKLCQLGLVKAEGELTGRKYEFAI